MSSTTEHLKPFSEDLRTQPNPDQWSSITEHLKPFSEDLTTPELSQDKPKSQPASAPTVTLLDVKLIKAIKQQPSVEESNNSKLLPSGELIKAISKEETKNIKSSCFEKSKNSLYIEETISPNPVSSDENDIPAPCEDNKSPKPREELKSPVCSKPPLCPKEETPKSTHQKISKSSIR